MNSDVVEPGPGAAPGLLEIGEKADLYDPHPMPPKLRRARQALDRAVDRLYRRTGFAYKRERMEFLFSLYEKKSGTAGSPMMRKNRRRPTDA